jgi:hypothetical protein
VADDRIVARHDRLSNAGETRYDWQHYIPLLQRKPGALRNGAPFADMPEPLQRLRRGLLRNPGGDRVMAQVLAIVLTAGLDAVLVAVELALETGPPGKVSVEHVVNVLGRLAAELDRQSSTTAIDRQVATHWRRGHWRRQPHGPQNSLRKLVWLMPTLVNLGKRGEEVPGHLYLVS